MTDQKERDREQKGLEKISRYAVWGTLFIIVVYSVYYYSNAYKHVSTNLLHSDEVTDVELLRSETDVVAGKKNLLYFPAANCAYHNTIKKLEAVDAPLCQTEFLNQRSTVWMSGLPDEGFVDSFTALLGTRFSSIPPVQWSGPTDKVQVRSIQFEHFYFPHHAMINWRDTALYKTFSFLPDSISGELRMLTTGEKGFRWEPDDRELELYVFETKAGSSFSALLNSLNDSLFSVNGVQKITLPILDFDYINRDNDPAVSYFKRGDSLIETTYEEAELKILVSPSLKQDNAYELGEISVDKEMKITPPFFVAMRKQGEQMPYFAAYISNGTLLLK